MATVTKSIDVHVPISQAYNQWTQFETFPNFMGGVEEIKQLDDRNLHWKVNVGGQHREFDAEITEQNPEERVAWKSTDGKTHSGVVTFHKLAPEETRVTVQLDWEPEGLAEKAAARRSRCLRRCGGRMLVPAPRQHPLCPAPLRLGRRRQRRVEMIARVGVLAPLILHRGEVVMRSPLRLSAAFEVQRRLEGLLGASAVGVLVRHDAGLDLGRGR
jgi:carbon monoxide dehydrogenase subunit G